MANKKNQKKRKKKFNLPPGMHCSIFRKQRSSAYKKGEFMEKTKLKTASYQLKSVKTCTNGQPRIKFVLRRVPIVKSKLYRSFVDGTKLKFHRFEETLEGNRLINLNLLKQHISTISIHSAVCDEARKVALNGTAPITLLNERRHAFDTVIEGKCNGCGEIFKLSNSETIDTEKGTYSEINIKAVWGSMVTGGGCSSLNECLGTMGVPGITEQKYSQLEEEIGVWWKTELEKDMKRAGEEERQHAIESNSFFQGIPAITVICDGGWSKRSHKHTYNAMGGVAVIFGAHTKKLLFIGVRNRLCYICSQARTRNIEPRQHQCFRNWDSSAQSMESDIIVEGFLECEKKHGVRYMHMIGDGDSSVFASVQQQVPIWGVHVKKLECANHATKCLRSSLEQLVSEKPQYKGKGKLTKRAIVQLVTGVRCAIRMRSDEAVDRNVAIDTLKKDIRNAGRHVLGIHDLCSSDFCKHKDTQQSRHEDQTEDDIDDSEVRDSSEDVLDDQCRYWKDSTKELSESEMYKIRQGGDTSEVHVDEVMLKDIYLYLNRLAMKADRLIGNFTSNLAESWMNIRCKFDGGKMYNKCFRGSFYGRCYGGGLRSMKGPAWSPIVYTSVTGKRADSVFIDTYRRRAKQFEKSIRSQKKPENKLKKRKRKLEGQSQCNTKRAKLDYGPNILSDEPDIPMTELNKECEELYVNSVDLQEHEIKHVERATVDQSLSDRWFHERKLRLTSSSFGEIVCRSPNNNNPAVVKRLLYTTFRGNRYTAKGLKEESSTIKEYIMNKNRECNTISDVKPLGFMISTEFPYLGASSDGLVVETDGGEGLLEMKNLLQNNVLPITDAVKQIKTFCLKEDEHGTVQLKRNHKYFYQVQGQLNILNKPWCDFVVRRTDPHDIFIERILIDRQLWIKVMVPKLSAFYFTHMLPELAVPRFKCTSGIRKPSIPWFSSEYKARRTLRRISRDSSPTSANEVSVCALSDDPPANVIVQTTQPLIGSIRKILPSTSTGAHTVQGSEKFKPKVKQPPHVCSATSGNANSSTFERVPHSQDTLHTTQSRSGRQRKVKFVGRRICHEWDEGGGKLAWYTGTVLNVKSGKDGECSAVYEVFYDKEDTTYEVEDLHIDYCKGSLKFIDV